MQVVTWKQKTLRTGKNTVDLVLSFSGTWHYYVLKQVVKVIVSLVRSILEY